MIPVIRKFDGTFARGPYEDREPEVGEVWVTPMWDVVVWMDTMAFPGRRVYLWTVGNMLPSARVILNEKGVAVFEAWEAKERMREAWEREVVTRFRGVFGDNEVKRGLQARSGEEVPDVDLPCFWIECKRGQRTDLKGVLDQATSKASKGRIPLAVCKDDHRDPVVVMLLDDFIELVREWWERSNR